MKFKNEIVRAFTLSCCLEPLGVKDGCTTRYVDSSQGAKLKYFIIAAINSIPIIEELVDQLLKNDDNSTSIFKYGYLAQLQSVRSRMGSKVNFGQILMLLPIIKAQCTLYKVGEDYTNVSRILSLSTELLKQNVEHEIEYFQNLVDLSIKQSSEHNHFIGKDRKQLHPKFTGKYKSIYEASFADGFGHMMIAKEFQNNYSECYRMYNEITDIKNKDLIEKTEIVYPQYFSEMKRHDLVADCIVVVMYLVIVNSADEKLFL